MSKWHSSHATSWAMALPGVPSQGKNASNVPLALEKKPGIPRAVFTSQVQDPAEKPHRVPECLDLSR